MSESVDDKVRRWRARAVEAIDQFDAEHYRLHYLGHRENVTFRVEVGGGGLQRLSRLRTQPAVFVLRFHHAIHALRAPVWQHADVIEGELLWLDALQRQSQLVCPAPHQTRDGRWVCAVEDPDSGQAICATLLSWVDGRHAEADLTIEQARALGDMLAQLHAHALSWQMPGTLYRPTYDTGMLRASLDALGDLRRQRLVRRQDFEVLENVVDRIAAQVDALGPASRVVSLIHADLHETNYVFDEAGAPRPIDFSCCGFGFLLFDVGYALRHIVPWARQAFLEGYHARRDLSGVLQVDLEAFLLWGAIDNFAFHAPLHNEQEYLQRAVPYFCAQHCRRYLRTEPFLFDV